MSTATKIEWTEHTWNPVTGCTKVSAGCDHCYAEAITNRFGGKGAFDTIVLHPDRLDTPLKRRKPTTYFVNSMSDLFHADVPREFLLKVFTVMAQPIRWGSPDRHVFQILTKRPGRMRDFMQRLSWKWGTAMGGPWRLPETGDRPLNPIATLDGTGDPMPLSNIWLGVSVENQEYADKRIPVLLDTPAAVRFLSCEPLLGPVDLDLSHPQARQDGGHVDWLIVGGESGPKARPMHPDWARSLRDQCVAANVPFFFKQWGEWAPGPHFNRRGFNAGGGPHYFDDGTGVWRVGKKVAGRELDGRTWDEMPGHAT